MILRQCFQAGIEEKGGLPVPLCTVSLDWTQRLNTTQSTVSVHLFHCSAMSSVRWAYDSDSLAYRTRKQSPSIWYQISPVQREASWGLSSERRLDDSEVVCLTTGRTGWLKVYSSDIDPPTSSRCLKIQWWISCYCRLHTHLEFTSGVCSGSSADS